MALGVWEGLGEGGNVGASIKRIGCTTSIQPTEPKNEMTLLQSILMALLHVIFS